MAKLMPAVSHISVKPKEASLITGVGRTKLYEAINNGELTAIKRGRSTLLMVDDLRKWMENSPKLRPR